jgi:hypothetical protein
MYYSHKTSDKMRKYNTKYIKQHINPHLQATEQEQATPG